MGDYIVDLRDNDVLLGRGSGPNDHIGNIRFRELVAQRKEEYLNTSHRLTKAKIAQDIVDIVFSRHGRFLKKLEGKEAKEYNVPEGVDAYVPVSEEVFLEKAKQALRQNASKARGEPKPPSNVTSAPDINGLNPSSYEYKNVFSANPQLVDDFEPIPYKVPSAGFSPAISTAQQSLPSNTMDPPAPQSLPSAMGPPSVMGPPAAVQSVQQTVLGDNAKESVFSRLPPHLMTTFLQQSSNADQSMAFIPDETGNRRGRDQSMAFIPDETGNRRGSMTMNELAQLHRMRSAVQGPTMSGISEQDMSVVMDSFSKMRTDDKTGKMFNSTETMGTIEPIGVGSVADMSLGTMNSDMFSTFLRGNDSSFIDDGAAQQGRVIDVPTSIQPVDDNPRRSTLGSGGEVSASSMISSQEAFDLDRRKSSMSSGSGNTSGSGITLGSGGSGGQVSASSMLSSQETISLAGGTGTIYDRRKSSMNTQCTIPEGSAYNFNPVEVLASYPRPLVLVEDQPDDFHLDSMGRSSLSVLKAAFASNDFDNTTKGDEQPPSNDQRE